MTAIKTRLFYPFSKGTIPHHRKHKVISDLTQKGNDLVLTAMKFKPNHNGKEVLPDRPLLFKRYPISDRLKAMEHLDSDDHKAEVLKALFGDMKTI